MLNGQILGLLSQLVSDVKEKDPENQIKEIHLGNVDPLLKEFVVNSADREAIILLCEVDGVPVFVNAKFGDGWTVVKHGESWKDHLSDNIMVNGVKPSKTWLRNNLNIFKKKRG